MPRPNFQALTIKSTGLRNRLISDLKIYPVFDPHHPPNPLPPPFHTKALWDTGATASVITNAVATALNLVSVGLTQVRFGGGVSTTPTYMVHFVLPNDVHIVGARVAECAPQGGFEAIIGMDVISLGDFSITNVHGRTCMSFRTPSCDEIDYVKLFNKELYAGAPRNGPCPCGSGEKYKLCHGK